MSGLVLKSRPAVSLGRRCLSLSAVSSTEKHTMPNPIDHATGENPQSTGIRYRYLDSYPDTAFPIAKLSFYLLMWNNLKLFE